MASASPEAIHVEICVDMVAYKTSLAEIIHDFIERRIRNTGKIWS